MTLESGDGQRLEEFEAHDRSEYGHEGMAGESRKRNDGTRKP
jgi:hypothetical protein